MGEAKEKIEKQEPEKPEVVSDVEVIGKATTVRSIRDIVADLSKPVAMRHLKSRKQGGKEIWYLSWHYAALYLDHYAPGWNYEIRSIQAIAGKLIITTRISIPCAEGICYREATGQEDEDKDNYGDSSSNSESMSLRRAAAKFGLGLYLYEDDGWHKSRDLAKKLAQQQQEAKQVQTTEKPEQKKEPEKKESKGKKKTAKDENFGDGELASPEQVDTLVKLCENPPNRPGQPADKNAVAKHYSGGRTEELEDLTAKEIMKAIDGVKALKSA